MSTQHTVHDRHTDDSQVDATRAVVGRVATAIVAGIAAIAVAPATAAADDRINVDTTTIDLGHLTPAPRPVAPGVGGAFTTVAAWLGDLALEPVRLDPCDVDPKGTVIENGGVRELDLDGEGGVDRAMLYFDGDWKLRVVTSSGVESELWLADDQHGERRPALRSAARIDGDADQELRLEVMNTAGATFFNFFGLDDDGCLFRFHADHGSPTSVMIRDVDGVKEHLDCYPGGGIVQVRSVEQSDGSWEVRRHSLVPQGPQLVSLGAPSTNTVGHESLLPEPGWSC